MQTWWPPNGFEDEKMEGELSLRNRWLNNLQYQDLIPNITSKILFDLVNEAFCKQQAVVI